MTETSSLVGQAQFESLYNDIYFGSQLKKFNERKTNHWAPRIAKVFDMVSGLDLEGNEALDLGASVGTYAYEFADRGFKTSGIDVSKAAIAIARRVASDAGKSISYVVGDITERSHFPSCHFDLIYAGDIVEHLLEPQLQSAIINCHYWLKPGGYLLLHTVPTKYNVIFHKTPLWMLLIPFTVFPASVFQAAVVAVYNALNIILRLFTGKSWSDREKETVHCNLQTRGSMYKTLHACGFDVLKLDATIMEDRFSKGVKGIFFKNHESFQKDLFGVARRRGQ